MNFRRIVSPRQNAVFLGVHGIRRRAKVLLEYDGPAIVRLDDGSSQFIGLAVDEDDDGTVRSLRAPVSGLEIKALKQGAAPLRRVFVKDRLTVVDYAENASRCECGIFPTSMSAGGAARPEVYVPGSQQRAKVTGGTGPYLTLKGRRQTEWIAFGEWAITSKLQALWNSIAQAFQRGPMVLGAAGFSAGSVKVIVHTDDPELFAQVANTYKRLVLASGTGKRWRSPYLG